MLHDSNIIKEPATNGLQEQYLYSETANSTRYNNVDVDNTVQLLRYKVSVTDPVDLFHVGCVTSNTIRYKSTASVFSPSYIV